MTYALLEGFDHQNPGCLHPASSAANFVTGRFGGYAVEAPAINSPVILSVPKHLQGDETTNYWSHYLGFSCRLNTTGNLDVAMLRGVTNDRYLLRVTIESGSMRAYYPTSTSTTYNVFSLPLVQGQWHTFEMMSQCVNEGTMAFNREIRVDGANIYSNVNTIHSYFASTNTGFDEVLLTDDPDFEVDDVRLELAAGTDSLTGFLGDRNVVYLAPDGDSAVGWDSSTGANHYDQVNDNSDSTYITTAAQSGDTDTFTFADLPANVAAVEAVDVQVRARQSALGTAQLTLHRGGTAGTAQDVDTLEGSGWNEGIREVFTTDGTDTAWTPASVNSSTFGIVANA